MMDYFRRITSARGMPTLPDDDETIEERWAKFKFVDHPIIRKLQRKCLMRSEHMRDHPELYPHLAAERDRERRMAESRAPAPATSSSSQEPFDFSGVEATAPVALRLPNGD